MSLTNHPPGHDYSRSGPKRCRSCSARVNVFSLRCNGCGEVWQGKRTHKPGYEPEPTTPAPAIALAFPDFDELPLGSAA